jgi:hypothetical protein
LEEIELLDMQKIFARRSDMVVKIQNITLQQIIDK